MTSCIDSQEIEYLMQKLEDLGIDQNNWLPDSLSEGHADYDLRPPQINDHNHLKEAIEIGRFIHQQYKQAA